MHEASASSKRDGSGTVAQSANAILGRLFRVRSVINGSFAFSERVQPLSNPVRSIVHPLYAVVFPKIEPMVFPSKILFGSLLLETRPRYPETISKKNLLQSSEWYRE